jgi:Flagellar hook-length control protein FliK
MKIPVTPQTPPPRAAVDVNKPSGRRGAQAQEGAAGADESGEATAAAGRDFASVLEEVARPRERAGAEEEGETFDAKRGERAEPEPEARRREEQRGGEGGDARGEGFDQRGVAREASATSDAANVRSILHIADLERLVSAVRTQTLAGGVREVTIDLRRSVLEGLRVRLTLDGAGHVAAEFVAGSERVRAQVEARAAELAEVMRSRGINLSSLRATVGGDSSGAGEGEAGRRQSQPAESAGRVEATGAAPSADDGPDAFDGFGTTYRA